jgi:SPP1 gp7 family putative phage head morphogenesis protein
MTATNKNSCLNRLKTAYSEKAEKMPDVALSMQNNLMQSVPMRGKNLEIERAYMPRRSYELEEWKQALEFAENPFFPNRNYLYNIYKEIVLDTHLQAVMDRIRFKCTNTQILYLVNGKPDTKHPINKILKTKFFQDLIKHIIDARFWGHSLIQLNFLHPQFDPVQQQGVELIYRWNVRPEFGDILQNQSDQTGIPYRDPPYNFFLLEIGASDDLGLLNKAVPSIMYKRFGMRDAAEFLEIYGMPIPVIKYDPRIPGSYNEAKQSLENRGSNGGIAVPIGSEFELKDSAKAGNYQAFEMHAAFHNKEISKLFLGQTMTTEAGSSLSQSQTHLDTEREVIAHYKMGVEFDLNDKFKHILSLHGYDLGEGVLAYDHNEKLNLAQLSDVLAKLQPFIDIPPSFIYERFSIPEPTAAEANAINAQKEKQVQKNNPLPEGSKKKKTIAMSLQLPNYPNDCCTTIITLSSEDTPRPNALDLELIKRVWEKKLQKGELDAASTHAIAQELTRGIAEGYGATIDYNTKDNLYKTLLEANVARFSAAKNLALVQALNEFKNAAIDFNDFEQKAKTLAIEYNRNWLKTEYNTARSVATNAAQYRRFMADADVYPYLQYQTVGDERVRAAHRALDGMTFKIGDEALTRIYPPNSWNCRCEMIPVSKGKASTLEQAIGALGTEWNTMTEKGWDQNRGAQHIIFTKNEEYIKGFEPNGLDYKSYKLSATPTVGKAKFHTPTLSEIETQNWFKSQIGKNELTDDETIRLLDYRARPIEIDRALMAEIIEEQETHTILQIENALQKPDEVWQLEGDLYNRRHLLFFEDRTIALNIQFSKTEIETVTAINTFYKTKIINDLREGILLFQSPQP